MDETIRIVILDYHTLVRAGMRALIERVPGMKVVGETGDSIEALRITADLNPDIVLFDMNLDGKPGDEMIPGLLNASGKARLILVTGITDTRLLHMAVEDGAMGVVCKNHSPEVLIKAIQKVNAGEVWLERSMIASVLSEHSHRQVDTGRTSEKYGIAQLSERELEVIKLIGQGLKNKKISSQLCISETTVRHHLSSIYSKLGVSDRLELLVFAHRNGLVNPTSK